MIRRRLVLPKCVTRLFTSAHTLWLPDFGIEIPKFRNVLALLRSETTGMATLYPTHNLITAAGDVWYAQRAAGVTPVPDFTTHVMCNAGPTEAGKLDMFSAYTAIDSTGSRHLNDANYPRVADDDADNNGAGAGVVTHRATYSRNSFIGTVTHGVMTVASPVAGSPLLAGYQFAEPVVKTPSDTLKVFVNHAVVGI